MTVANFRSRFSWELGLRVSSGKNLDAVGTDSGRKISVSGQLRKEVTFVISVLFSFPKLLLTRRRWDL